MRERSDIHPERSASEPYGLANDGSGKDGRPRAGGLSLLPLHGPPNPGVPGRAPGRAPGPSTSLSDLQFECGWVALTVILNPSNCSTVIQVSDIFSSAREWHVSRPLVQSRSLGFSSFLQLRQEECLAARHQEEFKKATGAAAMAKVKELEPACT